MPELAEVEFYRKQWNPGLGQRVRGVQVHPAARVFRECDAHRLRRELTGAVLLSSAAAAKQMLFHFSGGRWLGVHLGMTGELRLAPADYEPGRHDHLLLAQRRRCLVFTDPRMFGRVRLAVGRQPPDWWTRLPPPILSNDFTVEVVAAFLRRRQRAPIKAVLLLQERFPGIGNWMADEILWRAGIHPRRRAGSLSPAEVRVLWRECRRVCRLALGANAGRGDRPPAELNIGIPPSWLFHHRWEDGGRCPLTGAPLRREVIAGRMTCWSPARQRMHA